MTDDSGQPTTKEEALWAYLKMSRIDIAKRIGMTMRRLASTAVTVEEMVPVGYILEDNYKSTKEEVYKQLVRYLRIEAHYWISGTEVNISDLVYAIISPILNDFICKTGRDTVYLERERGVAFVECNSEGYEVVVVVDKIFVTKERYILVIEAQTEVSLSAAVGPCLLTLKDMHDDSGTGGIVYGFVTTGDTWRMLSYDGRVPKMTNRIGVVFDTMARDKEKWMKEFSVLVGCVYAALDNVNGG